MVFASRRTWIDADEVQRILVEDEYKSIPMDQAEAGDVVVYRDQKGNVSHVAVVDTRQPDFVAASWKVTVLSQWGGDGEYFHAIDDVSPFLGKPVEAWTDRIQVP